MSKKITISMTDRPPVTIDPEKWGLIASVHDYQGQYDFQSFRHWKIKVREHEDGRTLVYGWYDTAYQNECDIHAGYLIPNGNEEAIIRAIRDVGEHIGCEGCAIDRCIADLPAEELV